MAHSSYWRGVSLIGGESLDFVLLMRASDGLGRSALSGCSVLIWTTVRLRQVEHCDKVRVGLIGGSLSGAILTFDLTVAL